MAETNPYRPTETTIDGESGMSLPSDGIAWRALFACSVIGFFVGWLSRLFRAAAANGVHYEMLAAVFVQFTVVLVVAVAFRRQSLRNALLNANLTIAASWAAFFAGWSLKHGEVWDDLLGMVVMLWLASSVLGSFVLFLRRR